MVHRRVWVNNNFSCGARGACGASGASGAGKAVKQQTVIKINKKVLIDQIY